MTKTSFYCRKCDLDFDRYAFENGYSEKTCVQLGIARQSIKWYESKCGVCGGKVIRFITDKNLDPYFQFSRKIRSQKVAYTKDSIQYWQKGFQAQYPQSYTKFQMAELMYEAQEKKDIETRDELYKNYGDDISRRNILDKIYAKPAF